MTLTDFLLARVAEDEALARDSYYEGQRWYSEEESVQSYPGADDDDHVWMSDRKRDSRHIVNWQPARALAECEAKRRIIEMYRSADEGDGGWYFGVESTLYQLAAVYADHPEYRDEWRPA